MKPRSKHANPLLTQRAMSRVEPVIAERIRDCVRRGFYYLSWLAACGVATFPARADDPSSQQAKCGVCCKSTVGASWVDGAWLLRNTENFCICCPAGMDPAAFGRNCESLREQLI